MTFADTERLMSSSPGAKAIAIIRDRAPEDYRALVERLTEARPVARDLPPQQAVSLGQEILADLMRRNAEYLWRAPQASLVAVINSQVATLEALSVDHGACRTFLKAGSAALRPTDTYLLTSKGLLTATGETLFAAIYDGRDASVQTPPPTAEDYRVVLSGWVAEGVTQQMIDAFKSQDFDDPQICGAFQSFFSYLARGEGQSVNRVRTDIVFGLASG